MLNLSIHIVSSFINLLKTSNGYLKTEIIYVLVIALIIEIIAIKLLNLKI